jgi:PST family polysaccharide transporter
VVIGLTVGVWLARYLGPTQFGILSFSIAYVGIFNAVAKLGLDQIVIRNIVQVPQKTGEILGTTFMLKIIGGLFLIFLAIWTIPLFRPQNQLIRWIVTIIASGIVLHAFDVIDLWFRSQIKAKYSVWATTLSFLFSSLLKIGLILMGAKLILFAFANLFNSILVAVFLIFIYHQCETNKAQWKVNLKLTLVLLCDSWSLILSSIIITIYMYTDRLMLGKLIGDQAVGIYSAAAQITEMWYFVPTAIMTSYFPELLRMRNETPNLYEEKLQRLHDIFFFLSFIVAAFFSICSQEIISILFGSAYSESAIVLAIHIWSCVFIFHGQIRGQYLIAENKQAMGLIFRGGGLILNISLNLSLIPAYGPKGAALATLISFALPPFLIGAFIPIVRREIIMCLKSYLVLFRYIGR